MSKGSDGRVQRRLALKVMLLVPAKSMCTLGSHSADHIQERYYSLKILITCPCVTL